MNLITVEAIMAAGPCPNYPEHRVCELIEGGKTPREIADAEDVPIKDRYWALAMTLPARRQRMLACSVAEWALQRERAAGREPVDGRAAVEVRVVRVRLYHQHGFSAVFPEVQQPRHWKFLSHSGSYVML